MSDKAPVIPANAVFGIIKMLQHINAAQFYAGHMVVEFVNDPKARVFFRDIENRMGSSLRSIRATMTSDYARKVLMESLEDPQKYDALMDAFIALSPSNREIVEKYLYQIVELQATNSK